MHKIFSVCLVVACGGSIISTSGLTPPAACDAKGVRPLLDGLTPGQPVDGIELFDSMLLAGDMCPLVDQTGSICSGASNPALCNSLVQAECGFEGMTTCATADCFGTRPQYLVATQGDTVTSLVSVTEVAAFLAPIDTPSEAILLTTLTTHIIPCDQGSNVGTRPSPDGDGFDVVTVETDRCSGQSRVELHVSASGVVSEVARQRIADDKLPCPG